MTVAKHFVNDKGSRCVEEAIAGLVQAHPEQYRVLEGLNVVVRADFEQAKEHQVALICGGGSGHEPAHSGFVGAGALTASVNGKVFSSPSMEQVLGAIRTVTGPKGALLIVKNYTGDRLNFGLAAEQAKTEGLKVEMVVVGDDAALEDKGVTGRRGIAGVCLVHKVAGAAAASGGSLSEVTEAARIAAESVRTVGVSLSVCNVPGKELNTRLASTDGQMELGLGIHGEAGRETIAVDCVDNVMTTMCKIMVDDFMAIDKVTSQEVVAVVNNLGGTSVLEMYGLVDSLLRVLRGTFGIKVVRLYVGSLVTSLEMHGVSISLLDVGVAQAHGMERAKLLDRLDAGCTAIGWPGQSCTFRGEQEAPAAVAPAAGSSVGGGGGGTTAKNGSEAANAPRLGQQAAADLSARVLRAARALAESEAQLTEWDKVCGDGDAGETFLKGAQLVQALIEGGTVDFSLPHVVASNLADQAKKMGGSSGAVMAIFFTAFQGKLQAGGSYGEALKAGVQSVSKYGGAQPGYRTMLDPLYEMAQLSEPLSLDALAAAAEKGAEATKTMKANAGRSNYVPDEKLRGVPDPGAKAVEIVMKALAGN